MSIQLKLTWKDGKTWEYKSDRVVHEEEEAPPPLPTPNSIIAFPQKRHGMVPSNSKHLKNFSSNECMICGETGEKSLWIGCSHKNKLSERQDCNYWVHQWCIGLYYKKPENLAKVPYFCPTHRQKKQEGKQKKFFLSVCLPMCSTMCFSMYIANRFMVKHPYTLCKCIVYTLL